MAQDQQDGESVTETEAGYLPAVPDGADLEPEYIFDGEIVDESPAAPDAARPPVVQVFQAITIVVQAPQTKAVARHAAYVPAGLVVAWRRHRRGRNLALDFAHQAKASGDHANGLLWAQQHEAAVKARHERHERRVRLAIDLVKVSPAIGAVLLALMVLLNVFLFIGTHRYSDLAWSFLFAAHAVRIGIEIASALAVAAAVVVPLAVLVVLHEAGRRGGDLAPGWGVTPRQADEERGLVVTADGIVVALQHTPNSELRKALKDGWRPSFHTLPIRDGEGYFSVFSVPMGVTANGIADQVEVFARNLHRAKTEVWPTDAERGKIAPAGYVALWVANPGVLDRPAPEWPLLNEGTADVFQGVPAGVSPRGDALSIPVVANNLVCGGIMGQGKSNACRVVMLGAALDPLAELWVHVFAYNGFTLSSHLSGLTCRESKSGKMPRAARGLPRMSVAGSKRRPAAKRRHVAAGLPVSRFWLPPGP